MSQTKHFAGNFSFSLFAKLFYLITRIGMPPMVLAFVPLEEYGIWSIGFVVVSYLGLATAGFSAVYVREAAGWARSGDTQRLNEVVSTGVISLLTLGLVLSTAVWFVVPSVIDAFNIDPQYQSLARMCLVGCCWIFLVDMCLGASSWLLHGTGRFIQEQKVWVASYCLEVLVAVACLFAGLGIASLLVAFAVRYVFSLSTNAWLAKKAIPGLKVSVGLYRKEALRRFVGYGALVQLSSLCGTAFHSADRVIAGMFAGPAATALFDLAGKLPSTAISIPSSINAATLPMAAGHEHDPKALQELSMKASRWIVLLLLLPLPFMAGFSDSILHFWLGDRPELAELAPMMSILCVAWHLHVLTGPVSSVARGTGRAGQEFIYHGLRAAAYGTAGLWVYSQPGITLPAMAGVFALAICASAVGYLWVSRAWVFGSTQAMVKQIFLPALVGYPVALVVAYGLSTVSGYNALQAGRWEAGFAAAGGGVIYALAVGILAWVALLHAEEKQAFKRIINKLPIFASKREVLS